MALILVLVVPLYGQVSCNRNCPPSSNPCQRSVGRSLETNQCVYSDIDGATCDDQGVSGICVDGQCLTTDCAGVSAFGDCDADGGFPGACVEDACVVAEPEDPCVKVGVGRINCCSDAGCSVASGAYCNDPVDDSVDDGISCDPTGIEPVGQTGQDGVCLEGTCVATSGLCAGLPCPTIWEEQCARDYCNPQTGQCQEWWVDTYTSCLSAATNSPGFCQMGECREQEGDTCNGETCVSGPCIIRSCTYPCAITGDKICEISDYFDQTPSCIQRNRDNGDRCVGEPGTCFGGACALGPCEDDSECDDGNPCTVNSCNPFGGLCDTDPVQDLTPCGENADGVVLARCENGQCLPDLCLNRDCGDPDGNPCTGVCISPYGICDDDADLDNGTPCPDGQCLNGFCQPILTSECDHEPFAPDREFPECDDGKECTYNRCDFADQCINPRKPNGTPCANGNGSCIFGGCALNGGGGGLGL